MDAPQILCGALEIVLFSFEGVERGWCSLARQSWLVLINGWHEADPATPSLSGDIVCSTNYFLRIHRSNANIWLAQSLKNGSYNAPAWIVALSEIHKDQRMAHGAKSSLALKWFVVFMAVGLIATTLLGIYMAFKSNRDARVVTAPSPSVSLFHWRPFFFVDEFPVRLRHFQQSFHLKLVRPRSMIQRK